MEKKSLSRKQIKRINKIKENLCPDDFIFVKNINRTRSWKIVKVIFKKNNYPYAMKIIKKSKLQNIKDIEHFEYERKVLSMINHPFIAKLRFAFQTKRKLYIVTDYYPGGDLLYHIRNKEKFTENEAKIYLAQVLIAIEYLHKHNIIYRTLSPESITLDSKGYIRLSDFSLSKNEIESSYNCTDSFCGTSDYMAPEIIQGKQYGKCVDIWCLGVLLYEMLLGYPPFMDENTNKLYKKIIFNEPVFDKNAFSPEAIELLKDLLNKEMENRIHIEEVREYDFFNGISFEDLQRKTVKMPIIPIDNEDEYIDPELLSEKAKDSLNNSFSNLEKEHFDNIEYCNLSNIDSILSKESNTVDYESDDEDSMDGNIWEII